MIRKYVIGRRFYPCYYGKKNTHYSYRSFYVGYCRTNTSDYLFGVVDGTVPDGWVTGLRGAYATRTVDAVTRLPGFKYLNGNLRRHLVN